jgi:hypothetical protein
MSYKSSQGNISLLGVDRVVGTKSRTKSFRHLYDWLTKCDILVIRDDRSEPLVVLPLKLAAEIAAMSEHTAAHQLSSMELRATLEWLRGRGYLVKPKDNNDRD